jgi:hypothetical protein
MVERFSERNLLFDCVIFVKIPFPTLKPRSIEIYGMKMALKESNKIIIRVNVVNDSETLYYSIVGVYVL